MSEPKLKIAILDMNNGEPNQGLRCIIDIASSFSEDTEYEVFDVRQKNEIPDSSFNIYISSGGPDSPLEKGAWRQGYLDLIQKLWDFNLKSGYEKKYVFFICYSFQVACHYFELGELKPRRSTSFGILPMHKTLAGRRDPLLKGLKDPFYAVDSRDWQLIQPRLEVFAEHGATILSLEKIRDHVELERAIMAVRFSEEFVGTQFHPEADPIGMKAFFLNDINKMIAVANIGDDRYERMMQQIDDEDKIIKTHSIILPNFIDNSIKQLKKQFTSQE